MTVVPVFLGGRVEELSQAHIEGDFVKDPATGIYYLKIDEEVGRSSQHSPKSVKTEAGWRKVPIHPALVSAGFLDFLEGERKAGAVTPFQRQWQPHRDKQFNGVKHSHAITKWGVRELKKLQAEGRLPREKISYFHSMRHTFVTEMGKAGISEEWRAALAGHEFGQINSQIYNQAKHDVAVTFPIIEQGLAKVAAVLTKVA